MSDRAVNAASLRRFFQQCGYRGSRLAQDYRFDDKIAPLAGFFGKPWDVRSACVAAIDADDNGRQAAQECLTLGAPTVFVCLPGAIECWRLSPQGAAEAKTIQSTEVAGFFRAHADDLSPESIHRAKTRRPGARASQLWFVDLGLMPAVERRAGEALHRLVEGAIQDLAEVLGGQLRSRKAFADLYKTVFWLLAAKLLHEKGVERHRYLRDRLYGVEVDAFACELAKLSLTLADVPHGNSWRIDSTDMFTPGVLTHTARKHTVLLANPPFERFSESDRKHYERHDEPLTALTKAVEMLKRTLVNLRPGGVFGVVVPQGVLHDKQSRPIREFLLRECELSEVSLFADNLFEDADHETAILLGRRNVVRSTPGKLWYRRVRDRGMSAFKARLTFSWERQVEQERFARPSNESLLLPDLEHVWAALKGLPRLATAVAVQQGFRFRGPEDRRGREVFSNSRRAGWTRGVLRVEPDYGIWELPRIRSVDISDRNVRRPRAASELGVPQVIINCAPVAREPWRLKAVVDEKGLAVSSRFLVFRPKDASVALRVLWAILNSPVANAYAYCFSGKRETLVKEWRQFPLPRLTPPRSQAIAGAAQTYLRSVRPTERFTLGERDEQPIRRPLLLWTPQNRWRPEDSGWTGICSIQAC